ncbi:MAG: A/G-specific adenine glycosylase [Candidatus Latescibacteria bacterium]|jgi:A/G-specific adenine glycosylase|nr:A/G-specific adenine glycosylase [Candidatus Latescibacterota bacterium]
MSKKPNPPKKPPKRIGKKLLAWYHANKRDMPWRQTKDPYCILLSEFMLQQTQVDTVIPYYHHFLEAFPTVHHLARAPQDKVLKTWEGLGYYARARNLHKAAKAISLQYDGTVPDTYDELQALPGFGPYTTAAVLSIAYNKDHAVLDGNVIRVLTRLLNIHDDVTQNAVKKQLWELAESLLAKGQAGDYNQAVMELGATVCTPKSPNCQDCPLVTSCDAHQAGTQASLPVKAKKKPRPHHMLGAGIVWHKNKVLITQRPENGLLGGLWEFPAGTQEADETLQETCSRGIKEAVGIDIQIQDRFRTVKHAFTHFSITIHAFQCHYKNGKAQALSCDTFAWVSLVELSDYAFSRTSRKLADFLQQNAQNDLFIK